MRRSNMPTRKLASSRPTKSSAKSTNRAVRVQKATAHSPGFEASSLREHLLYLLRGGGAHLDFEKAIAGLPAELRGAKPSGLPFSAWGLLEHMRIAQWDILEFSRDAKHTSPAWPEGYWPKTEAPPSAASWNNSLRSFRADLKAMAKLVADQ